MKRSCDPERDGRRRRPIPWPRHVEIAAIFAAVSAVLVVLYVLFGGASENLRRFAVELGYEDSYVRHCEAGLAYYLRTFENQRLVQKEYSKSADPYDVLLAYDAQDSSGVTVRGEFRCLFRHGGVYSSDFGPSLNDVEVNGEKLSVSQKVEINLFAPSEMRQNR